MGMSRWWMLGAVLPLVAGCGGSNSSDDDRVDFGVVYTEPATVSAGDDGLPVFTRVDLVCSGVKGSGDEAESITIDLGLDVVTLAFQMKWINNELSDQNVVLTGDGFKVSIYTVDAGSGSRSASSVWNSDFDYTDVNNANGNGNDQRYFESQSSGVELGSNSVDTYDCNDSDVDGSPDSSVLSHSGGVIGENSNVSGDSLNAVGEAIVGDDQEYTVTIPQSEEVPGAKTIGPRVGSGQYIWWGLGESGEELSVDNLYEAEMEIRICKLGVSVCEDLKKTYQFRIAAKVEA